MAGFGSPAQIGAADLANMLTTGRRTVVLYYVSIEAIGHWLLKTFWSMVISCVLRTQGVLFETMPTRSLK